MACPQGPACCTYWVRVPASGVRYVSRTVATQVHGAAEAYLAEFRDKMGKGELTYEDGWVEVTK